MYEEMRVLLEQIDERMEVLKHMMLRPDEFDRAEVKATFAVLSTQVARMWTQVEALGAKKS